MSLVERCFFDNGGESGFSSSMGLLLPLERADDEDDGGWSSDVNFSGTDWCLFRLLGERGRGTYNSWLGGEGEGWVFKVAAAADVCSCEGGAKRQILGDILGRTVELTDMIWLLGTVVAVTAEEEVVEEDDEEEEEEISGAVDEEEAR